MKTMCSALASMLILFVSGIASGQTELGGRLTVSEIEGELVNHVEAEFLPAAEAMPEDKYSFVPSNGEFKGVRTFAQQVKHVASNNYFFGAAILEETPPAGLAGGNGPNSISSKAEILTYTRDSFAYLKKALRSINEKNEADYVKSPFPNRKATRLGLATLVLWHVFDHYGQMVEYLRMNGIVPPASRK